MGTVVGSLALLVAFDAVVLVLFGREIPEELRSDREGFRLLVPAYLVSAIVAARLAARAFVARRMAADPAPASGR